MMMVPELIAYVILGTASEAARFNIPYYKVRNASQVADLLQFSKGCKLDIKGLGKFQVDQVVEEPYPSAGVAMLSIYCTEIVEHDPYDEYFLDW